MKKGREEKKELIKEEKRKRDGKRKRREKRKGNSEKIKWKQENKKGRDIKAHKGAAIMKNNNWKWKKKQKANTKIKMNQLRLLEENYLKGQMGGDWNNMKK